MTATLMMPPLTFFLLAVFAAAVLAPTVLAATLPAEDATWTVLVVFGPFAGAAVERAARRLRRETMSVVSAELGVALGVFGSFKGSSEPGVPNWAKV
jgi:hypothetical protein